MYNESLEKYQSEVKNSGVDLDKIDANGSLFWERYHRDLERQKAAEEERKRQEAEEKLKREQRHKENMERFEKKWIRESEISKRLHAKADGLYRFGYRAKKLTQSQVQNQTSTLNYTINSEKQLRKNS